MIPSGVVQRDERKRTADERSKQNRRCQNPGRESLRDESGRSPEARPRRHPAERRREPEPGSCMERENLSSRCQGKGSSGQPLRDSSTDAGHRGRTARSRVEGVVMTLDRRGCGVQPCVRPTGDGRSRVIKAKPFDIPKREVWEAFKHVKANQGAAGVDGQSIEDFEARLGDNLYKLWNRLSSGSYMPPPVRRVDIPSLDFSNAADIYSVNEAVSGCFQHAKAATRAYGGIFHLSRAMRVRRLCLSRHAGGRRHVSWLGRRCPGCLTWAAPTQS
jgi:hypothetical protein